MGSIIGRNSSGVLVFLLLAARDGHPDLGHEFSDGDEGAVAAGSAFTNVEPDPNRVLSKSPEGHGSGTGMSSSWIRGCAETGTATRRPAAFKHVALAHPPHAELDSMRETDAAYNRNWSMPWRSSPRKRSRGTGVTHPSVAVRSPVQPATDQGRLTASGPTRHRAHLELPRPAVSRAVSVATTCPHRCHRR